MIRFAFILLLIIPPCPAFAEIVGEDIISHSVSLMTGAVAAFSLILGIMISK